MYKEGKEKFSECALHLQVNTVCGVWQLHLQIYLEKGVA